MRHSTRLLVANEFAASGGRLLSCANEPIPFDIESVGSLPLDLENNLISFNSPSSSQVDFARSANLKRSVLFQREVFWAGPVWIIRRGLWRTHVGSCDRGLGITQRGHLLLLSASDTKNGQSDQTKLCALRN
jgi:hypothetical protein